MTLDSGPVFDMARKQFHVIADHLSIPDDERECLNRFLPNPYARRRTPVFTGSRVQHHLTLGPAKGGTRFARNVDIGEVAALAVWGHVFHVSGNLGSGDRYRKTRRLRRNAREARSDGHGVAYLALQGLDALETEPLHATAIVQGFGSVDSHAAPGLASSRRLRGRRLRCEAHGPTKAELFYSPIFLFLLAPRKLHGRFLAKRRPG